MSCYLLYESHEQNLYASRHRIIPVLLACHTPQKLSGLFNLSLRLPDSVLRLLTPVGFLRQNGLILSEVFLFMERSKNHEKKIS